MSEKRTFRAYLVKGLVVLAALAVTGIVTSGCSEDEPGPCAEWVGERVIATASQWSVVPLEDDPFRGLVSGDPEVCQRGRYGAEFEGGALWFGIDTVDCAYITIRQPTLERLCPGDQLSLRLWHFALTGESEGYEVALGFGEGEPDLKERVLVPAPGELLDWTWSVDRSISAGTPITFHLSNHGINSWGLLDVTVIRE